jgi:hypothetical protein
MTDGTTHRLSCAKAAMTFKRGSLYRVHLDVDPDTLLDWDKPSE